MRAWIERKRLWQCRRCHGCSISSPRGARMTRVEPSVAGGSGQTTQSEADLDTALADSFPASDPPFWSLALLGHGEVAAPEGAGWPPLRSGNEPPSSEGIPPAQGSKP